MVRPTQHPSWHFVTTRVQNLHKRAIRANELGGNGSSCGLITRQNAPLAPVSIARHPDTSAEPPEAPLPDPPCRPDGAEGFRLASSHYTASSNCGLRAETRQTWTGGGSQTRLIDHIERLFASQLAQAPNSHPRAQTGGGPARRRTQPCTISGSEDKPTLHSLEAS